MQFSDLRRHTVSWGSCLRVGFSSTRPSRWRLKLVQRAKLESTETTGYKLYSHTPLALHTCIVLLELHLGTMGETFLHAGVAIPGHDSFPILPLWPDPGSHPGVAFSRDTLRSQFGLPVRAMAKRRAYEPRTGGPLPHTPIPACPVEPMSRRQSRGTNLTARDPFISDPHRIYWCLPCLMGHDLLVLSWSLFELTRSLVLRA